MKIKIDADACIGCGLCVQVCADVYEMEGDKAVVKMGNVPEDKADDAKNAADQCPVNAISVH